MRASERAEDQGAAGVEARILVGDGKTLWAEISAALRTLVGGGRYEVVGVLKDVTERTAAESERSSARPAPHRSPGSNRGSVLAERAGQALASGDRFSLVLMDLDGFKDVNDTLGHEVGDQVLVAVAARLADNLRQVDFLARLGGDEFAVVVPEAGDKALALARRLLGSLHGSVEIDGVAVSTRASAGVVTAPDDGPDAGTLLRRADSAMYSAKHRDSRAQAYAGDDQGAAPAPRPRRPAPRRSGRAEVHVHLLAHRRAGRGERLRGGGGAGALRSHHFSGRSPPWSLCLWPSTTGWASNCCAAVLSGRPWPGRPLEASGYRLLGGGQRFAPHAGRPRHGGPGGDRADPGRPARRGPGAGDDRGRLRLRRSPGETPSPGSTTSASESPSTTSAPATPHFRTSSSCPSAT